MTSFGGLVQPQITIPNSIQPSQISIGQDGTVTAAGQTVGKLHARHRPLAAEPRSRSATTPSSRPHASGNAVAAPAATTLKQGALEASNTDISTR